MTAVENSTNQTYRKNRRHTERIRHRKIHGHTERIRHIVRTNRRRTELTNLIYRTNHRQAERIIHIVLITYIQYI